MNVLLIIGGAILAAVIIGYLYLQSMKKKMATAKVEDQKRREDRIDNLPSIPLSDREDNAIYQWSFHHGERRVAQVVKAEVDESAKQVTFAEITHSDLLLLPDECHYQKYKIEIDTVGDAVKIDANEPEKSRILRDVAAHITGYVEQ